VVIQEFNNQYWRIAPSMICPDPGELTPQLKQAMEMQETNTHPKERQGYLGRGINITSDRREACNTYESPPAKPDLIDPCTVFEE
jgi:hypothetical protein